MKTKASLSTLLLTAALVSSAQAQQTVDSRRAAAPDGRVAIENIAGSIRVIGWNRDEVAVKGTLGDGAEGLALTGSSHRTRVEVETAGNPHGVKSDLEIHVPAASRLEIESFSADITVSEVKGEVRASSVNGSIAVSGPSKEVFAETVGGSVSVTGAAGRVNAQSVNGPVTLKGVGGEIDASTVNGRLELSGGALERCRLETVSGDMRIDAELGKASTLQAQSVSGGIELRLPASVAADFAITSFSGEIENELGPAPTRHSRYTTEKALEFQAGGGGAKVELETLSGDITLRKR